MGVFCCGVYSFRNYPTCFYCILLCMEKVLRTSYSRIFIEDGNFFLNTKRPLRFPLNTIDYVCLRAHYLSKGTDYMSIQVMRKDGNHSARYIFDSSIYTKKKETLSNRASIDETLSSLAWELKTQSVPYKVIKEGTYRFQ